MNDKVTWLGHEFSVHPHGDSWLSVAGLYIFAAKNLAGQWLPLCIGQAASLAERIPTHERWQEAVRLGATHVHASVVAQKAKRDSLEDQLILAYQPGLNVQGKIATRCPSASPPNADDPEGLEAAG